jgi:F0F1-type ATP synthase gamma subunit
MMTASAAAMSSYTFCCRSAVSIWKKSVGESATSGLDPMLAYIFEPNAESVLDAMLPHYIQFEVFQIILDAPRVRAQRANGNDEERD